MKLSFRPGVLLLLLAVVAALTSCGRGHDSQDAVAAALPATNGPIEWARVEFTVQGMDCAGCVIGARAALRRLDGVKDAGAAFGSLEASSAWAVYDPARVTPERMMAAIRELGYTPAVATAGRAP